VVTPDGTPVDVPRHAVGQWEPAACLLAMSRVEVRKTVEGSIRSAALDSNHRDALALFTAAGLDIDDPVVQRAAWTALAMVASAVSVLTGVPQFRAGVSTAMSALLTTSTSLIDHVPVAGLQAEIEHGEHRRGHE
jgi:hypothetical protein